MARKHIADEMDHPHLVVCSVSGEARLEKLIFDLEREEIKFEIFREPDLGNEITAVATEPVSGNDRRMFRRLPLLR